MRRILVRSSSSLICARTERERAKPGEAPREGRMGAAYFIPTLVVPLLLITHGLVFRILLQH